MGTTSPVVERGLLADFQGMTYARYQRPHVVVRVQVAEIDQRSRPGIAGRERQYPPARGPHVPDAEGVPVLGGCLPRIGKRNMDEDDLQVDRRPARLAV